MIRGIYYSDAAVQGETNPNFASAILRQEIGGTAPLFALTSGMQSFNMNDNWSTMWFDEKPDTGRVEVAAAATAAATAITLADNTSVTPGGIYIVESTNERLFVTAVSGSTGITVVRGFQNTSSVSAALASGDYLQKVGNAFPEGSDAPSAIMEQPVPNWNVAQIVRTPWDISNTAAKASYRTGNKKQEMLMQMSENHSMDIERILWEGRRWLGTSGGKPMRTMGGLSYYNTENITVDSDGAVGYDDINTFIATAFRYQIKNKPQERIAFTSNQVITVLNSIAKSNSQLNLSVGATTFGLKIMEWVTPFGTIKLLTHPMFNQNLDLWGGNLWLIHPGSISLGYYRQTLPYTKSGDGRDAQGGGLTTELSAQFRVPYVNACYQNIQTDGDAS